MNHQLHGILCGKKKRVLTGIHGQNHVRVVFISEEAFLDEVLHLCDGGASLVEIWNQKGLQNFFFSWLLPLSVRESATVSWQTTQGRDPIGRHDRTDHGYGPWNVSPHSQLSRGFRLNRQKGSRTGERLITCATLDCVKQFGCTIMQRADRPNPFDRLELTTKNSTHQTRWHSLDKMRLPPPEVLKSRI
jgi:hypothetical protein